MTRTRPAGFATVTAMVSLVLISITTAGLMTRISLQARRTHAEATRAQRSQIAIARSMGNTTITLPAELRDTIVSR